MGSTAFNLGGGFMESVSTLVEKMAKPIVEGYGFELAEVSYQKKFDGMELSISLYHPERSISIEDCELISKALDEPLEQLNPTNDKPYNFVVGSLGLDRQMKTTRDFERNLEKEVEIKLFKPIDKIKQFVGVLKNVNENDVTVLTENGDVIIERKMIASAKLNIEL